MGHSGWKSAQLAGGYIEGLIINKTEIASKFVPFFFLNIIKIYKYQYGHIVTI